MKHRNDACFAEHNYILHGYNYYTAWSHNKLILEETHRKKIPTVFMEEATRLDRHSGFQVQ